MAVLLSTLPWSHGANAQTPELHPARYGPSPKDFGYDSLSDIARNLPDETDIEITRENSNWYRQSAETDFTGADYYLVQPKCSEKVYFVVTRPAHGVVQIFGPIKRLTERSGIGRAPHP